MNGWISKTFFCHYHQSSLLSKLKKKKKEKTKVIRRSKEKCDLNEGGTFIPSFSCFHMEGLHLAHKDWK